MKENSIEEDIEIIEKMIKSYKEADKCGLSNNDFKNEIKALEHVFSDYKRVLKENEELKQEKINNYRMIALAQNEALGYMQGYEDGKKLKTSAIASIVENQQYYIIKKQMEKYEEHIAKLQKENEELKNAVNVVNKEKADWIRAYQEEKDKQFEVLRSSIPVKEVKDKIEELNRKINNGGKTYGKYGGCVINSENIMKLQNQIEALQELLERRK